MYKKITIVDDTDAVIGYADYPDAIAQGLLRRVARVFVFDEDGRQLLQKRSQFISYPFLLDQAAGGHVDEGEDYAQAAMREMEEEIGLRNIALQEIALSHRTDVFNGIFKAVVPVGTEIHFNAEEVEAVYWLTETELERKIAEEPQSFIRGYIDIWRTFRDTLVG